MSDSTDAYDDYEATFVPKDKDPYKFFTDIKDEEE